MSSAATGGGSEPPPIPKDAPAAPRRGLSKKAIALIVAGALGLALASRFGSGVTNPLSRMQETQRKITCMTHLSDLSQAFLVDNMDDPKKARRWSGSSLWLAMRCDATRVSRGAESIYFCPGDAAATPPHDATVWDRVDLEHPPRELCSYAGRDFAAFPIDLRDDEKQAIGACVHHLGGAIVAFNAGDVQFLTREELGLGPDDPIVVGPESKSPLLRTLVGGN